MDDSSEFRPVTFRKERDKTLQELADKAVSVTALVGADVPGLFLVTKVDEDKVEADAAAPLARAVVVGDSIQLIFGLGDGMYIIRSKVERVSGAKIAFTVGADFHRMQRRNNFRVPVKTADLISFELQAFNNTVRGVWRLPIQDLSAGGIRVTWLGPIAAKGLPTPTEGAHLAGVLTLPEARKIEVFGSIKTVLTQGDVTQVGIAFTNLAIRDEQALLFVCMQMLRERNVLYGKI